ncbi:MAG: hypothetical protein Q9178_006630 [Gyalolechia marmorata]
MEYLIWPQANITKQDVNSVETFLKSLVTDSKQLYASRSAFAPMPAFWLAVLDQKSYQKVAAHPKVGEIGPNEVCDAEDVAPIRGKVPPPLRYISAPVLMRLAILGVLEEYHFALESAPTARVFERKIHYP